MPYFSVYAMDRAGVLDERTASRPSHRARLREHDHAVTVHVGGPVLSAGGAMAGTLLIIEAADQAAVEHYLAGDPYVAAGIFDTIDIRPFAWGIGLPESAHG